jgi:hypothetical protein
MVPGPGAGKFTLAAPSSCGSTVNSESNAGLEEVFSEFRPTVNIGTLFEAIGKCEGFTE